MSVETKICGFCRQYMKGGYCWRNRRDVPFFDARPCFEAEPAKAAAPVSPVSKPVLPIRPIQQPPVPSVPPVTEVAEVAKPVRKRKPGGGRKPKPRPEPAPVVPSGITKECACCGQVLPLEDFARCAFTEDGHLHICRTCHSQRIRTGKAATATMTPEERKAHHRAVNKAYYFEHHDRSLQSKHDQWQRTKRQRMVERLARYTDAEIIAECRRRAISL